MAFKQRKPVKDPRNKYLRPGALAQIRNNRAASRACIGLGKKKAVLDLVKEDISCQPEVVSCTPAVSPSRMILEPLLELSNEVMNEKVPETPKTPQCCTQSRLEALPMELLVKILCHMHHDQLRAVFHVSQRIRRAVLLARQWHFNYTTPDRSRQEMHRTKALFPSEHKHFVSMGDGTGILSLSPSPRTPKAPKHAPRLSCLHPIDMKQVAAILFPESSFPSRTMTRVGLRTGALKSMASNKLLFNEEELCQAILRNKLH